MLDNQIIHTEHRDVIHDCSYDYYGQVRNQRMHQKMSKNLILAYGNMLE